MVKAIQIDSNGNDIGGTMEMFTEARWADMVARHGEHLRWRKVEVKPLAKKQSLKIETEDEKTDFPPVSDDADNGLGAGTD